MKLLDVTEDLPIDVEVGQILTFDFEGSPIHLKIMRKKEGRVWAKKLNPAKYLSPEEADSTVEIVKKH